MVAERMKEQGEGYVDNKSVLKTPVEAQAALLADTTYLETGETKVVVRDPADLPTAKEFTEAFK
eukprot:12953940-Ditylum_brightwellii.AAC.1